MNNDVGVYDVESPVIDADFLIDFIKTHMKGYIVQLTGGEPLTHPAIGYITREISKTNKIIMCTNGELIPLHKKLLDIENVIWRISYHPEYRRDKFEDVMKLVIDSKANYIVNYVCHPRHIENGKVVDYINEVQKYNNEISEFEGQYKNQCFRLFDEIYDGLRTPIKDITFGLEMITIRPNGLIFSCHGQAQHAIGNVYRNVLNDVGCNMSCKVINKSLCPTYNSIDRIMNYYKLI